jgi:hypothetical protein
MTDLLKDLSLLSGVSYTNLTFLNIHATNSIAHTVLESILENSDVTEVDIGIGTLKIQHKDDEIRYKFIPNETLSAKVTSTVKNKQSPVAKRVGDKLGERINKAYKDLF